MFLLFDIGGTTTRMAISHTGDSIDEMKLLPTNHDFDEAMDQMRDIADELSKGEKFHAVVGGVRAYNRIEGQLFNQPNYPMWVDKPILERMKQIWGDVYLENDAALVGLGEAIFGSGKGYKIVGYITLSTGVGGARITNNKIDFSHYSFEPGNMLVSYKGEVEYVEKLISGSAIQNKYKVLATEISNDDAWEEVNEVLAIMLNNVSVLWSPDVIVLGGSVPQKLDLLKVKNRLSHYLKIYPEQPGLVKASLDEAGGLYGCLAYLQNIP